MRTALAAALLTAGLAGAADWPQWLGPTRDGVWAETGVLDTFPAGGPKKRWAVPVGGGYSGPAVAAGKVYLTDYTRTQGDAVNDPMKRPALDGTERLSCFDAATGARVWDHSYPCPYSVSYPAGPRATPTVHAGRVYAVGAMGDFVCCDAATGELLWKKDFKLDYAAKTPVWGFASHPLIYDNLVVNVVGGDGSVVVALDAATGAEVWKKLSAPEPGYSAPVLVTAGGADQLVVWHAKSVNALNPRTGDKYWSVPLEPAYGMAIQAPRQGGEYLYAGGIGGVGVLLKLDPAKPAVTEVYRGTKPTAVYPVNSNPVIDAGTLYAVDQPGMLRAVDLVTGKRLWATYRPTLGEDKDDDFRGGNSGTAFIVKNGDKYFLFGETGVLTVAKLTPAGYTELGRAKLVEPTGEAFGRKVVWSCPAFSEKCVFVRNDAELACFSLAK